MKQAFKLNKYLLVTGNIDMDDSDGGSSFVANACYECWSKLSNSDDTYRKELKKWFENYQDGYVIDIYEEYIEEIILEHFATGERLMEEIQFLDAIITGVLDSIVEKSIRSIMDMKVQS
ncbi:MAG: hypothetical protein V8S08_04775 [Lachnoclostridium sp.]